MTALEKYIRLESTGEWSEGAGQSREIVVSFGNATLVLSNFDDQPQAHWSLAALNIVEQSDDRVVYSPDSQSPERLVLCDAQMIEAIIAVTKDAQSFDAPPVKSNKVPNVVLGLLALILIALATWQGPDFLRERAVSLVPKERAELLGHEVLAAMHLNLCETEGNNGMRMLTNILSLPRESISVFRGSPQLISLPGGNVLVSDGFLQKSGSPEELAGWIAMAHFDAKQHSAMQALLAQYPLPDVVTFLLNGAFQSRDIDWMAGRSKNYARKPTSETLVATLNRLAKSGVPDISFLGAFAKTYPHFHPLPRPNSIATFAPMMRDQSWVGLQEICGA